jgi:adenylate kinase
MLREHIEAADAIGRGTEGLLKSGKLVPDEFVNDLLEKRLAELDCRSGVILDGYPRTLNQAGVLLKFMPRFGLRPAVVHLIVDREKIVARLSGRRQCPVCGTLYNLNTNPPKVDEVCDLDGATLVTREDDRESVIRQRLQEYESQTRPILDYFREAGVPMFEIAGIGDPQQIAKGICDALKSAGLIQASGSGKEVKAPRASVTS